MAEYEYPRYFFSNLSADIRGLFCEYCERLGIRWTQSNHRNISVSDRAQRRRARRVRRAEAVRREAPPGWLAAAGTTRGAPARYRFTMEDLAPGTQFAGHRIEEVAGRGGMGVVYRATQLALERTVALKVIAPGLMEDAAMRRRFLVEVRTAASLDHPNVIPLLYAGESDGVAYLAMRYVAGDDLRTLVRREGPLEPGRAARIVAQIGAALDAAHAAGLVHRDVKPANVLLGPGDHVYLTDFGLTKQARSLGTAHTTRTGHWVGTLDYVAPEQIRGERIDARADVYALGCVLFFALCGVVPFPARATRRGCGPISTRRRRAHPPS